MLQTLLHHYQVKLRDARTWRRPFANKLIRSMGVAVCKTDPANRSISVARSLSPAGTLRGRLNYLAQREQVDSCES
jgi:hypothetical protein